VSTLSSLPLCCSIFSVRRTAKSQIIIKRPNNAHKNHPRSLLSEQVKGSSSQSSSEQQIRHTGNHRISSDAQIPSEQPIGLDLPPDPAEDDLDRIRTLLRPPPIPGVIDWGIPGPSTAPCDPAIKACLHLALPFYRLNVVLIAVRPN